MRLAVFTNRFPSRVSTFFARDMRPLLDAGFEVDVFPVYNLDPELWQYVPDILPETSLSRDRVHHLSFSRSLMLSRPWPLRKFGRFLCDAAAVGLSALPFGVLPVAKSLYTFPKTWAWARQSSRTYDHVLAYWGNYAGTCARLFHSLVAPEVPFSIFLRAGIDLYRDQVYLRQKMCYADNILVSCEFNREFIRKKYPDVFESIAPRIHHHFSGVDLAELPFQPDRRSSKRILGIGGLKRYKGFKYLLQAAHELVSRRVDIEVELIGDGEDRTALETLVRQLGIRDRVSFKGWQPFAAVRTAMVRAALLVHPSPVLGDAEPNVIKEAQSLGTPVVASNVAGIPELLDHGRCGILVPPKDVQALADAIESLLADEALRRHYALAARRHAEKTYNMWENGARLANLLRATKRQREPHRTTD